MSKRNYMVETVTLGTQPVICDRFRLHPLGVEFFNYGSQEQFVIFYPVGSFTSFWEDYDYLPSAQT